METKGKSEFQVVDFGVFLICKVADLLVDLERHEKKEGEFLVYLSANAKIGVCHFKRKSYLENTSKAYVCRVYLLLLKSYLSVW